LFQVAIELHMPDSSVYTKEWKLFASIDSVHCALDITPFKVEIAIKVSRDRPTQWAMTLQKQQVGLDWDTLETKEVRAVKRANVVGTGKAVLVYPTSSQRGKNVDWDQLNRQQKKDEEEEPESGDAGLNKLFQKIYGDGDEDTRRAMIKSYQTSGGTVLSTNWKEVAEKDYAKGTTAGTA
jgi:suppressor of G2 allele of SKP1